MDESHRRLFQPNFFQGAEVSVEARVTSGETQVSYSSYLNEFGNRNKSALPDQDNLSEMNSLLCEMLAKIKIIGENAELEKKTKTQKKKAISDITSIVEERIGLIS
jgi:hypothetical protein